MGSAMSTQINDQLINNNNNDDIDRRITITLHRRHRLHQVRFDPDPIHSVCEYYLSPEEEHEKIQCIDRIDKKLKRNKKERDEQIRRGVFYSGMTKEEYDAERTRSMEDDSSTDHNDDDNYNVDESVGETPQEIKKTNTTKLRRSRRIARLNPRRSARLAAKPRINYKE